MTSVSNQAANCVIYAVTGVDRTIAVTITENSVARPWGSDTMTALIYQLDGVTPAAVTTWTFTKGAAGAATMALTAAQLSTLGVGTFRYAVTNTTQNTPWFAGTLSVVTTATPGTATQGITLALTTGGGITLTTSDLGATYRLTSTARRVARAALAQYTTQTAYTVTASTPTITPVLSAANGASTITNGIKVPFARTSATIIDVDNDPNYVHQGVVTGKQLVVNTDMTQGDILTGGTSQAAGWEGRTGFWYTGQKFGIYFNALAAAVQIQVWVNCQPIATTVPQPSGLTIGARYHYEIDFGSSGTRLVEYMISRTLGQINGVTVEPGASIRRAPLRPKMAVLGDSTSAGANGVNFYDIWPDQCAPLFGMDHWKLSIGGTGYSTLTGTSAYIDRVSDVVAVAPDILIISGGQNDQAQSTAQMTALATTLFQTLQAALPNTIIMALGCHQVNELVSGVRKNVDEGIKAAAAACSIPFRSLIDPCGLYDTTTTHTISTAYAVGDRVRDTTNSRNVWVCHTAHTSGGANPDVTKFYAQSFITGQGKVGATTGRGNADLFVGSDGIHYTKAGHAAYAGWVADWIAATLRALILT